jgi:predicted regulator of Ras-like GTPase activity (Roadblock/LC7/MglB family)
LDAAYKVARGGLTRYPGLAEAHDLLGRILGDQGDLAGAFDAWVEALRFDPMRTSALKGIAFLYFRAGDVPAAVEHLQRAAEIDPDDRSIAQALLRVQSGDLEGRGGTAPMPAQSTSTTLTAEPAPAESQADTAVIESPFSPEAEDQGLLLVDGNGLRLSGNLRSPDDEEVGDRVAAELAGVSKEAARTSRLLGLGAWQAIAVESPEGNLFLVAPTPETILLTMRDPSLPMARLGLIAERAARDARAWLGSQE